MPLVENFDFVSPQICGANTTVGFHLADGITRWRDVMKFPDLDPLDWKKHAEGDTASWDRERRMSRVGLGYGLQERMFSVVDLMECRISLKERSGGLENFFARLQTRRSNCKTTISVTTAPMHL